MTDSRLYGYTPQELVAWQPPKYRYVIDKAVFIDNGSLLIYGEQGDLEIYVSLAYYIYHSIW